jgi:hypothetical protein
MPFKTAGRTALAIVLSIIAAISTIQTRGVAPILVSADNTVTIQLLKAPTANESIFANGNMEINLKTGDVRVELHQATADSTYTLVFVSGSAGPNVQVGVLATNHGGEGNLQATLSAGAYVGFFELTRAMTVEFVSATTSIMIGTTASSSVSETTTEPETTSSQTTTSMSSTQNQTQTTISWTTTGTQTTSSQTTTSSTNQTQTQTIASSSNTAQVQINVDPTLATINAGAFAKFKIHVEISGEASILLAAKGVPPDSVAIFTQDTGVADPEFSSILTVVTSFTTPPGIYGLTLVALINGQESDSQIGLEVTALSTVTQTTSISSISASVGTVLALTLYTNSHQYTANDTVMVQGHVTDDRGNAVGNAAIAVQVDASSGAELYSQQNLSTDLAGIFQFNFKLPASVTAGTCTVFASASKAGYVSTTTHTTFVVGSSSTPSIIIKTVYAGDSSGNPSAVFTAGQTVYIWVTVENIGATFQGVIWVQVRDPNGVPVSIQIRISNLTTGETITDGFGLTFLGRATVGLYSVNALVSDKLISQGGTFFANANTEFALTG